MNVGITLGCVVALTLAIIAGVSKFNSLDNRLQNIETKSAKEPSSDEASPVTANAVQVTTPDGEKVVAKPVAVNVSARDLACLKLIDDYTSINIDFREPVKKQIKEMHCFEGEDLPRPAK